MNNYKWKAKLFAQKIIKLRQKAIINRFIAKEFPYAEIKTIEIDFLNLPEKLSKEYDLLIQKSKKSFVEQTSQKVVKEKK